MDGQGIPSGVTVTGANVHDSRLTGAPLENSREMGSRGEEVRDRWRTPARRWVVERTFAWLKGFRSLRTRYCCYLVNFMGLLYLALACILWRKLV
ncbi:transposase [Desulfovibrio piger]|uniref:transposase n=1 Tax=Desulfovibrio piger TaxID=901 RepID=UPI003D2BE034